MKKTSVYVVVAILAILTIGMIVFTYIAKNSLPIEETVESDSATSTVSSTRYGLERIDAKHFYRNGTHTIVGTVSMPTPCDLFEGSARVMESLPETVVYAFSVINTSEMCAQMISEQRFRVDVSASELANLQATFLGNPIELNLVPASLDENPDDFELFIKG